MAAEMFTIGGYMSETEKILNYFKKHQNDLLDVLTGAVKCESPSHENKEVSDQCGLYFQKLFIELGCTIQVIQQADCGDHFIAELGTGKKGTLLIGHYDTVFPIGTLKTMPFKIECDKAYGPGVMDMKGGIILGYFAVKALKELNLLPDTKITFFINSDEESGSFHSRDLIVEEAKKNKHVLVLEPGLDEIGTVKVGRYGRGTYKITAHGRAAHSGTNPHSAISPMLELSNHIMAFHKRSCFDNGLTMTPTCMGAGIPGTCVSPETAWLCIDCRFGTQVIAEATHQELMKLKSIIQGVRIEVEGGIDKPVFSADFHIINLSKKFGKEVGIEVVECTVGGGSDGNFTSAAGCPTLDGLGMSGQYLHNPGEYININHIPQRGTILARLIQNL
jgi:glutamate carboxypeptidase